MLTNKRKLKNRKKTIKRITGIIIVIVLIGGITGYVFITKFLHKSQYISPIAHKIATLNSAESKNMLVLKDSLDEKQIAYKSIVASGTSYKIIFRDNSEVIVSSQKNIRLQISSLQYITSRLTMEGRRFSRLDLSFDKPIIVFDK
ncbi:MAG TPA: hypothetical protein VE090_02615 [Methylomirabilota bacterium]|nr:hypothetical protein [Methylomirabilota bacterium]